MTGIPARNGTAPGFSPYRWNEAFKVLDIKRISLTIILSIGVTLLSSCSSLASSVSVRSSPPSVSSGVTSSPVITTVWIPCLEIESNSEITSGIRLGNAAASVSVLKRSITGVWSQDYKAGDPCILVTGTLYNDNDLEWQVSYRAEGYDAQGNRLTFALDYGPIPGLLVFDIDAHAGRNFTLHMKWMEGVSRVTVIAHTYDPAMPLP